MITEEEFLTNVENMITGEDRKKYEENKRKMVKRLVTWILLETCFLVGGFKYAGPEPSLIVFAILGVFITIIMIIQFAKVEWNNLKSRYIHQIFKFTLEGFKYEYEPNHYIDETIFRKTEYDCRYDEYSGEDLLKINIPNDDGSSSNVVLQISDLLIKRIEKSSDQTVEISFGKHGARVEEEVVTVFSGVLGYVEFPFEFTCGLALNKKVDWLDKISLEDVEFNKIFKSYTSNEMEALRILTPTMIEKLKNLSKWAGKFEMVFDKNRLYFKIPSNIFEINVKSKKLDSRAFLPIYNDLFNIVYLVEEVKNNNRIFKM